jgi:hypothetical protein
MGEGNQEKVRRQLVSLWSRLTVRPVSEAVGYATITELRRKGRPLGLWYGPQRGRGKLKGQKENNPGSSRLL